MKKALIIIGVALVVIVAILLVVASTKPDTFRVERATTINAPPEKVFAFINDFHNWGAWSPYETLDPAMNKTYSGSPSGTAAVYEWNGNSDAGAGRMEITESSVPSRIVIKLDFLKPFEAHNTAEFILEPGADATKVTWAIYGPNLFIGKIMSSFLDMDTVIGKDFETGLDNLKAIAEK